MPTYDVKVENRRGDRGGLPSGLIDARDKATATRIAKRKAGKGLKVVEVKRVKIDFARRPGDFVLSF